MIPSQSVAGEKPVVEVVVEGELSPFEDESMYRILRKGFRLEHPSYVPMTDESLATRVNVTFHSPYEGRIFTDVLRENWRDLKDLLKQVRYRRGKAGAAFNIGFTSPEAQVFFRSGTLNERELASALDQIGHLTAIIGQMIQLGSTEPSIVRVDTFYDPRSDRWQNFQGSSPTGDKYVFDESSSRWVPSVQ